MRTTLTIKGTHCNSCKMLIEDVCKEIPGIQSCIVDFNTGKTEVEHDESADWSKFQKEVGSLGQYKIENLKSHE